MFRTKLTESDDQYIYSNSFENALFNNARNPHQAFFEFINDNKYAIDVIEEKCFDFNGRSFYQNDIIEDLNTSSYYLIQKDVFGETIFITHDFETIQSYRDVVFTIPDFEFGIPLEGDADEFLKEITSIQKGEIVLSPSVTLKPNGQFFVSDDFKTNFKESIIDFGFFLDDSESFELLVKMSVKGRNGCSNFIRGKLEEAFAEVGKILLAEGATLTQLSILYSEIEARSKGTEDEMDF